MTSGEGPSHEANVFIRSPRGIGSPGNTAAVDEKLMGSEAGKSDPWPEMDSLHGCAKMRPVLYRERFDGLGSISNAPPRQGRVGDRAQPIKGPSSSNQRFHIEGS